MKKQQLTIENHECAAEELGLVAWRSGMRDGALAYLQGRPWPVDGKLPVPPEYAKMFAEELYVRAFNTSWLREDLRARELRAAQPAAAGWLRKLLGRN